jgi:hypothetical protein
MSNVTDFPGRWRQAAGLLEMLFERRHNIEEVIVFYQTEDGTFKAHTDMNAKTVLWYSEMLKLHALENARVIPEGEN